MAKWEGYLISAAEYDACRQITSLKRHHDTDDGIDGGEITDKTSVASDIAHGIPYMTIYGTLTGWRMGERIRSLRANGGFYLRVDDNKVEHDNLGSLPALTSDTPPSVQKRTPGDTTGSPETGISQSDLALLKGMGANHPQITMEDRPSTTQELALTGPKKSRREDFIEYEKEYLKRIEEKAVDAPETETTIEQPQTETETTIEQPQTETTIEQPQDPTEKDEKPEIQAYCVKCRIKRTITNPVQSKLKNGTDAIKGTCLVCSTQIFRIGIK